MYSKVWDNFWQLKDLLKMTKNAFYFTSKYLKIFKIINFLFWLFGHVAKRFHQKDKVNFKFCDVTASSTKSVIHILLSILRKKGNQTMKFGQLIQYNMRNTFLEKSYRECGGETGPRPFSEKLKSSISLDQ